MITIRSKLSLFDSVESFVYPDPDKSDSNCPLAFESMEIVSDSELVVVSSSVVSSDEAVAYVSLPGDGASMSM